MKKLIFDENPGVPLRAGWRKIDGGVIDFASAVSVLQKAATGEAAHVYQGLCPDAVEGHQSRDPDCEVCRALIKVEEHQ